MCTCPLSNERGFSAVNVGGFSAALIQVADGVFLISLVLSSLCHPLSRGPIRVTMTPMEVSPHHFCRLSDHFYALLKTYGFVGYVRTFYFFKPAVAAPASSNLGLFGIKTGRLHLWLTVQLSCFLSKEILRLSAGVFARCLRRLPNEFPLARPTGILCKP